MNLLSHKKLLIYIVTVFTLCTENNAMGSDERSERKQGNLSGVNAGGSITQNFNEHKGGEGGRAEIHNHIGSAPLSPKTPDDYFEEGRNYLDEVPPNYNKASFCFLRAVGAAEQHLKIEAYIQLAVCKRGQNNASEALAAYENALSFGSNDTALRGLMELHCEFAKEADDDMEYLVEEFRKAQIAGDKIGHKDKEVRLKLKQIRDTLAEVDPQKKAVAVVGGLQALSTIIFPTTITECSSSILAGKKISFRIKDANNRNGRDYYLDGITSNSTLQLAPSNSSNPYWGTHWEMVIE